MGASRCARLNSVAHALRTAVDNDLLKVIRSMYCEFVAFRANSLRAGSWRCFWTAAVHRRVSWVDHVLLFVNGTDESHATKKSGASAFAKATVGQESAALQSTSCEMLQGKLTASPAIEAKSLPRSARGHAVVSRPGFGSGRRVFGDRLRISYSADCNVHCRQARRHEWRGYSNVSVERCPGFGVCCMCQCECCNASEYDFHFAVGLQTK